MTNVLSVVEIFRCVTATTKKREYTRMNEKTKNLLKKRNVGGCGICCVRKTRRSEGSFFFGWFGSKKLPFPPANIWQLVVGLASLVELCLRRESVGHEAEKGVVKGSVER